jgi:antitoxin component YwqK of YwqJK toxin-antitoxin module
MNTQMKILILFLTFTVSFSLSFSQDSDSLNNNNKIFYYPSGEKSSEGQMINGKPEGYWKSYYKNANLQSEGNRKDGLLDGEWKFYTESGVISKSITYYENKKNGYYLIYDSTGTVVLLENYYINDSQDSIQKEYYDNGCLKLVVMMKAGKKTGIEKVYAKEGGRLIAENTYDAGFLKSTKELNQYDKDSLKTGFWQELHANGKVKSEGYYKKGKPDGLVKNYNSKGAIDKLEKFKDGKVDEQAEEVIMIQLHKEYHPNGKIRLEGGYTEGLKQGVFREFDLTGDTVVNSIVYERDTMIAKGIMLKNGEYEGKWEYYYLSGALKSKGKYINGIKEGKWIFYYENGKKEQEGKYKKGVAKGMWTWYYPNSTLKKQENFRKGKPEGEYVEYDENGNEIVSGEFFNGKPEGLWTYQYNDHYSKGEYSDGDKDGKWIEIYLKTGRKRFEGEFAYGEPKGKHRGYYPSGRLKYFGKYKSGKRHGVWRYYRENGAVAMEVTYKFGRPVLIDGEVIRSRKDVERLLKEME